VQGIAAMNMTHFGVHHEDGSAQSDLSVRGHGRHCRRLRLGFRHAAHSRCREWRLPTSEEYLTTPNT